MAIHKYENCQHSNPNEEYWVLHSYPNEEYLERKYRRGLKSLLWDIDGGTEYEIYLSEYWEYIGEHSDIEQG